MSYKSSSTKGTIPSAQYTDFTELIFADAQRTDYILIKLDGSHTAEELVDLINNQILNPHFHAKGLDKIFRILGASDRGDGNDVSVKVVGDTTGMDVAGETFTIISGNLRKVEVRNRGGVAATLDHEVFPINGKHLEDVSDTQGRFCKVITYDATPSQFDIEEIQ